MNADIIIYLISDAIRIGIAIHLLSVFLTKSRSRLFYVASGLVYWLLNGGIYIINDNAWLNLITNVVFLCMIAIWGYSGPITEKILVFLLDMAVGVASENLAAFLLRDRSSSAVVDVSIMSLFLFFFIAVFIGTSMRGRSLPGEKMPYRHTMMLILISIGINYVGITIIIGGSFYAFEVALCVLVLVNISIVYLYDELRKNLTIEHEYEMYRLQSEMYRKQLDIIQQTSESDRIWRHDIKHHIFMIQEFAREGKLDKIDEYLKTMSESILTREQFIYTGDSVIDSVLNYNRERIESISGIFTADMVISDTIDIDDADLNVLLSNLLSNAYEASLNIEDPKVNIYMRYNRGMLNIVVSNRYDGNIKKHGNRLITTKQDPAGHGIGLVSIHRIVEKYHGFIDISNDDNLFTVRMILYDIC